MIIGIGTDIVEVNRILEACKKGAFVNKCFTDNEKSLLKKRKSSAAGNFAVKEAIAKMLGTGFVNFGPKDIEVLRDDLGRPYAILHNVAKEIADKNSINKIHVSISDTNEIAIAYVVGEKSIESE